MTLGEIESNILNIWNGKLCKEGQGLVIPPQDNKLRYSSCLINFSFSINISLQSVQVVRSLNV